MKRFEDDEVERSPMSSIEDESGFNQSKKLKFLCVDKLRGKVSRK